MTKPPFRTYTDDWDDLSPNPVEYTIVEQNADGYAVAQSIEKQKEDRTGLTGKGLSQRIIDRLHGGI